MIEIAIAAAICCMIGLAYMVGSARGRRIGEDRARAVLVAAILKMPEDRDDAERELVASIRDHLDWQGWSA